jgi:hypothetical protein
MKHGVDEETATDGGQEVETVEVDRDELDLDGDEIEGLPGVDVTPNAIIVRQMDMREIAVTDPELKQEIADELKELVREGGSIQV